MKKQWIPLGTLALLTACGGGSSSSTPDEPDTPTTVSGLELPTNLSLLTAQGAGNETTTFSGGGASKPNGSTVVMMDFDDAGTDYSNDVANRYVYDDSMESLQLINEIICYMSQTQASAMVNEDPYIALINEDRCRQGENQNSTADAGQSNAGDSASFVRWIVDSRRADNDSPQIVRIWLPNSGDGDDQREEHILVETTVTEGVSDTNPFGSFSMNFRGVADGESFGMSAGTEVTTMHGSLQTVDNDSDEPQFRFINLGGDAMESGIDFGFGFEEAVNVVLADADATAGRAQTHRAETYTYQGPSGTVEGGNEESYAIDYDTSHFLSGRDNDGDTVIDDQVCRSRTDFDSRIWRYNLYHAVDGDFRGSAVTAGQQVALNSGFPFSFDRDGDSSAESYGWVGYHGVWVEDGIALPDGQTILEYDYDSDMNVEHTVAVSPGRLTRRTASQASLADLIGEEFQFWGQHPSLDMFDQWLVTVGDDGNFSITARLVWGDQGPKVQSSIDHDGDEQTPAVSVSVTLQLGDNETLWLWSESLGGEVVYVHDSSLALQAREVTFYLQEFVQPDDGILANSSALTLYCYDRCLKGGLTQTDVDAASSDADLYYEYQGTPFTYTLSISGGRVILTDDANDEAVDARSLSMTDLGYDWGIGTGEMLAEALSDPNSPWGVYDQAVSYRWETGPNDWNVLVTVVDTQGDVISFDKPLQFNYTHATANDANEDAGYDGVRFLLQYSGVGDLHGFPWTRENDDSDRWYPLVALADSVSLTDGNNTFVVKALELEQSMQTATGECTSLDVSGLFADTELALPTVSDIGTVSFGLADMPVVTDAAAVVDGEIQE